LQDAVLSCGSGAGRVMLVGGRTQLLRRGQDAISKAQMRLHAATAGAVQQTRTVNG